MTRLDIYHNYNGKLFCDFFSHVILYTPEYSELMDVEIEHRGIILGVAGIMRIVKFPFAQLKDSVSFLAMGKPSQYLAADLNKRYNYNKTIEPGEMIMHMIIGWTERNMEAQGPMLSDWWKQKTISIC